MEARVGVRSGGGAICSGAESFFLVLRSIFGQTLASFLATNQQVYVFRLRGTYLRDPENQLHR